MRGLEDGFGNTVSKLETGLAVISAFQGQQPQQGLSNGHLKHSGGLVTPPSPRSLSAESTRPRQRKKRTSASRGRTRSRSTSTSDGQDQLPGSSASSVSDAGSLPESIGRASWAVSEASSATDMETHHLAEMADRYGLGKGKVGHTAQGMPFPLTPESSVLNHPLSDAPASGLATTDSRTGTGLGETVTHANERPKELVSTIPGCFPEVDGALISPLGRGQPYFTNLSTAFGVLVLSAAAAAVIWRVKPEGSV